MWDTTSANIGTVAPGTTATTQFTFNGDIELIPDLVNPSKYQMVASCDCTGASWNPDTKTMRLTFKAKPIPLHLISKGEYFSTTSVVFPANIDGVLTSQRLEIVARVSNY